MPTHTQNALKTAARIALLPAALALPAVYASAQYSGVSHPEEIPITTSPEGIAQPVQYEEVAAPAERRPLPVVSATTPATTIVTTPTAPVIATPVATMVTTAGASAAAQPSATSTTPELHAALAEDTLRPARVEMDGAVVERVDGPANQLPAGTLLRTHLDQDLSSVSTQPGSAFTATLTDPIGRDGKIIFPAGAVLSGKVTEVRGGKRIAGRAMMHLTPQAVLLPDGTRYMIHAQVVDTGLYHSTRVDREGTILRRDHPVATLAEIGLGAGSGAAAGGVFGGVPGALIGAGVGAGIGTVVWLKQDRQAELPAQTPVVFALTGPMTIGMESAGTR